jgi:hypothetical protein
LGVYLPLIIANLVRQHRCVPEQISILLSIVVKELREYLITSQLLGGRRARRQQAWETRRSGMICGQHRGPG